MSDLIKLDKATSHDLRQILAKYNISNNKVIIDFKNETIDVDNDYSIEDILDSAGILTANQAKELMEEIKRIREDDVL